MKKIHKYYAATMAFVMLVSFAGCGGEKQSTSGNGKISGKQITLTYWSPLSANATSVTNLGDLELYKELEKKTNIKIKFKHPPIGQENEQFGIMMAARDLPDILESNMATYPGGPVKAITDNIIVDLSKLIDKNSPNLKKIMDENAIIKKQMKTDDGKIFSYPCLILNENIRVYGGPLIRKDALDQLGLTMPETISDWETVLTKFKESGYEAPFTLMKNGSMFGLTNAFVGAYGVTKGYYVDNGKVKYGPMEQGYKEFMQLLRRWYEKGIIDPDFLTQDSKGLQAKITNEKSAATIGYTGGDLGKYLSVMKEKNPKFNMVATQYPVLNKGQDPLFIPRDNEVNTYGNVCITTNNKYPNETAKWLDYAYSQEGHMLYNFGVEGSTYNMENGYPKYTDLIMKNPDGLSISNALAKYTRANYPTIGYQDERYLEQYYQFTQQKEAAKLWSKYADSSMKASKTILPPVSLTAEESNEISKISAEVKTYVDEMHAKFILNANALNGFDEYVKRLKESKIERAVEIQQAAYDRYMNRK